MAEAKIDLNKLDTKSTVALTRRGRLQEGPTGQVASGYGLGMSGMVSDAAGEAASSGLIPVVNPQVMRGMRLDKRGVGGQTFSDLQEDIANQDYGEPSTKQGDAGNSYKGDASSGEGVYGRGTGPTDFYASGRDAEGTFTDDGSIAMAREGDLAMNTMGNIASGGITKGALAAGSMYAAGMPNAGLAGVGVGFKSMLGTGMAGALNQISGAVVGSEIGTSVAGEVTTESQKKAREAARQAAVGDFGLVGMGIRTVGSWLGDLSGLWESNNPYEDAQAAYDTSTMVDNQKAAGEQWAQGLDMSGTKPRGIVDTISSYKDRVFDMVPSMTELGFTAPDVQKPWDANMSSHGNKGVLEKGSPQQQAIADRKPSGPSAADKAAAQRDSDMKQLGELKDRYDNMSEKARDQQGGTTRGAIRDLETKLGIGRTGGYTGIQGREGGDRSGGMTGGQPGAGETGGGDYGGASRGESGTIGGL